MIFEFEIVKSRDACVSITDLLNNLSKKLRVDIKQISVWTGISEKTLGKWLKDGYARFTRVETLMIGVQSHCRSHAIKFIIRRCG